MSIEVGAQYRFAFTVRNDLNVLVDPTTKVVTTTRPDMTTATPAIVADSTGTFHADYTMLAEGLHKFAAVTTGPVSTRTDYINAMVFRSVVGIDEVKLFLGYTDTDRDSILRQVMMAATEKAESIVGTCVQRTYTNDQIPGSVREVLRMPHAPLPTTASITSISSRRSGGPVYLAADLIVYPDSGTVELASGLPFDWGPWQATYSAGRQIVSEKIQLAVKEMIFDLWSNHRPYGLDDLEPGPEETAAWEAVLTQYEIPPHARAMLESEEQPGFA